MTPKKFLGLRTCAYKVSDITRAKEWYTRAFGVTPYFDQPFYVGFNVGGYELGLQPDEVKKGDSVLTYWGVDDINLVYTHLLSLGAKEHEKPQEVGDHIVVASVKDPWDNIIGIIYNPHFSLEEPPMH